MSPDPRQQVRDLLARALARPAEERADFLTSACGGDTDLRSRVETLLLERARTDEVSQLPTGPASSDPLAQSAPKTLIGSHLLAYRIIEEIGAGGMGVVYLAEDTRLGRRVAIKLLPAEATDNGERVRRFLREAQAASALNHPNIVTIYDIGVAPVGHFIVMEHVDGRTLRELSRERVTTAQVIEIGLQIARALEIAHSAGIIHRDIKPENLMLRADGYVKILDFGLARLVNPLTLEPDPRSADETLPGVIVGTLSYMSPEQSRGEPVRSVTDIFSLGIVLYELATGQRPFRGATPLQLIEAIVSVPPLSPSRLNPEIPAGLEEILLRMLEKDARRRPAAAEVAAQFTALRGEPAPSIFTPSPLSSRAPAPNTVGREREFSEILAAYKTAAGGRSLMLGVCGEPGIGKSTLVEKFLAHLERPDRADRATQASAERPLIARGRCSERLAGAEAYLPFLEMLDSLLLGRDRERVAVVMKMLAPTWYSQVSPVPAQESPTPGTEQRSSSQERMKRELALFLTELSVERPLVLFLDDLHWADPSTVDLLAYLATKFADGRLFIIATYRPSELLLDNHPFHAIKLEMLSRGALRELPLEFLTSDEVARYLALEYPGHRFPPGLAALIHARTEGNPLFMTDLVKELRDRGVIAEVDGRWALADDLPAFERDLPASIRSLIERKIERLSEKDRAIVTAGSVQGYEFDSAVIARVLGEDPAEVEDRLEVLERVHSLLRLVAEQEMPDRTLSLRYRFVHVLYQNSLYGSLRPTRRASLSRSVAETLEGFYGERSAEIAGELALLFETGRDFSRAVDYFLVASQKAARVFANHEAAELCRRAIDLLPSTEPGAKRAVNELAAQMTLGVALMSIKGFGAPEVETAYSRAREIVEQVGDDASLFPVLYGLWTVSVIRARYEQARELGERMMRLAQQTGERAFLVQAHYSLGITDDYLGAYDTAREHLAQVCELYDISRHRAHASLYGIDPKIVGESRLSWITRIMGDAERAREMMEEADQLARMVRHPLSLGCALVTAAVIHEIEGEPEKALALADEIVTLSAEHGLAVTLAWGKIERGYARVKLGETEAGILEMTESLAILRAIGSEMGRSGFLVHLADGLKDAGRHAEALEVIEQAIEFIESTGERYYEADLYRLRGELLWEHSRQAPSEDAAREAEESLVRALEIAQSRGARMFSTSAAASLGRLWKERGGSGAARAILAAFESSNVPSNVPRNEPPNETSSEPSNEQPNEPSNEPPNEPSKGAERDDSRPLDE